MLVRCKVAFTSMRYSLALGEIANISDEEVLNDLLKAGYIEQIKEKPEVKGAEEKAEKTPTTKKAVKKNGKNK